MKDYTTIKTILADDGILEITLTRPDKLNAINNTMLSELAEVFADAKENSKIFGVLMTGEGKAFCAGADITRLAAADSVEGLAFAKEGQRTFALLENLGKPSLAAVNGYAFGGGCELAMSATLRSASDKAQFGQPEVKLGVIPGYGGTQRLSRLIGKGRAMDLCVTGRFIDANTAYQWGLVTLITTPDNLLTESRRLLKMATDQSPIAVAKTMQVIHEGFDLPLDQALLIEALAFAYTCSTPDKKEGTSAFLEKRAAKFHH